MNLNNVTAMKFGTADVSAVYLGQAKLWPPAPADPKGFTAFYESGEAMGSDLPTWWILIKGTAAADYALMFRPGPSPNSEAGYPQISALQGGANPFPALTPVIMNGVIMQHPLPVQITAGMTAIQIGKAIAATWDGVESTPSAGPATTLKVAVFPPLPVMLSRIPARVRATFGAFDLTKDCVLSFRPETRLQATDAGFAHFFPLIAWRQDAGGHWVEYQPTTGTQASGTVIYIDTTGGMVPDPNNVPASAGAVPVSMKWTWTDAGGQPLAGADMDVEIWFGPDANSLVQQGAAFAAKLDGNGEYTFNDDIDHGPGRYEYRGTIGGTVVTQVFIGV